MSTPLERNVPRRFTLGEARHLLPMVKKITAAAVQKAQTLEEDVDLGDTTSEEANQAMRRIVQEWATHIAELGCVPKATWLVDFDNGEGCFCWQHGEEELGYFHTYEDGFAGRTAIH